MKKLVSHIALCALLSQILIGTGFMPQTAVASYSSNILGTTGSGPVHIALDNSGNVYTVNLSSNNVSKITPAGVSTIFATTGSLPQGIAIDSSGNVYTTNTSSNNVSKITPAGVSTIFATTGSAPRGIVIDSSGNVYTANGSSNNVSKITPAGVSTILGTTGSSPRGIVIDSSGNIYTVNFSSSNVSKITPTGVSTILGTTGTSPQAIAIDSSGNVYTANSSSNNVSKISPAGVSTILASTGTLPRGIVVDSSGNVYTANFSSSNVSKITPAGVSTILGTTGSGPYAIALDSSGNVYTPNLSSSNVSKFSFVDDTPPILTLSGSTNISLSVGSGFTDPGANWTDNVDGSGSVLAFSGSVNTAIPGTYLLEYRYIDVAGNPSNLVSRTVTVMDMTAPVLTLSGSTNMSVSVGSGFTDPGADWTDDVDGSGSVLAFSGSVNTAIPGTYLLEYRYTDVAGNPSNLVSRTVNVHTNNPSICYTQETFQDKLLGEVEAKVMSAQTQGTTSLSRFSLRGNSSSSGTWIQNANFWLGDIDMTGVAIHNSQSTYRRNGALITPRHVLFTDHFYVGTGRTLTFMDNLGDIHTRSVTQTATTQQNGVYISQLDSDLPASVKPFRSFSMDGFTQFFTPGDAFYIINTSNTKDYSFLFQATDFITPLSFPHFSEAKQVNVYEASNYSIDPAFSSFAEKAYGSDSSSPSFILYEGELLLLGSTSRGDDGDNIVGYNHLFMTHYLSMVEDINQTLDLMSGGPGLYEFEVLDGPSVCSYPPLLTLSGSTNLSLSVGSPFIDSGADWTDDVDGSGSVLAFSGSVNTAIPGTYLLEYRYTDVAGNPSNLVSRTVTVMDMTAPVLTLSGSTNMSVSVGSGFTDPGADWTDDVDGSGSVLAFSGSVNTAVPGTYLLEYRYIDVAGNPSNLVSRTVTVQAASSPSGGGGTGSGRSRDICPYGDLSRDLYDTICTTPPAVQPNGSGSVQSGTGSTPEAVAERPEEVLYPETPKVDPPDIDILRQEVDGTTVEYSLGRRFEDCPTIDALNSSSLTLRSPSFNDSAASLFSDSIDAFAELSIVVGNRNGLFEPDRAITRAEFTKIVLIAHCYSFQEEDTSTPAYKDLESDTWEARVASKAQKLGIIHGYDDGSFRSEQLISKAEATKILMGIAFIQINSPAKLAYTDLSQDWHKKYVQIGQTLGVFDPEKDEMLFKPESSVIRAEMVDMIHRVVDLYR